MDDARDVSDRLVDAFSQVTFAIMGVLTRVAAENDMSLTQFRTIGILRDRTLRMADLADYLGLDRSTLSGLIDRSAARGLVERVRSETDRRSYVVRLTDAGRAAAARVGGDVRAELAPLLGELDAAQQTVLADLLEAALGAPLDG